MHLSFLPRVGIYSLPFSGRGKGEEGGVNFSLSSLPLPCPSKRKGKGGEKRRRYENVWKRTDGVREEWELDLWVMVGDGTGGRWIKNQGIKMERKGSGD